jgi:2-polyprenyl-3-methyl-5-hydroxy-6-metoxy-1,4-benzoquinol methylase
VSGDGLWESLSADYDRFVDWPARLARELPTLEGVLQEHQARRVLDVACGTGHHAIALAQRGYEVLGVDASAGMIERSRENADAAGVTGGFVQAGFGDLGQVASQPFDAVLCLGNSLPSLLSEEALLGALRAMAMVLVPGGVLFAQNLNYDRVWPKRERFLPLESSRQGEEEWLFLRLMDFHERTLTFNMVVLHREDHRWSYTADSTELRPIFEGDLLTLLDRAGFFHTELYGDYALLPYERDSSGDLIVVTEKKGVEPRDNV